MSDLNIPCVDSETATMLRERERCAKIAEGFSSVLYNTKQGREYHSADVEIAKHAIATEIRSGK